MHTVPSSKTLRKSYTFQSPTIALFSSLKHTRTIPKAKSYFPKSQLTLQVDRNAEASKGSWLEQHLKKLKHTIQGIFPNQRNPSPPALWADSLPSEPSRKPMTNTYPGGWCLAPCQYTSDFSKSTVVIQEDMGSRGPGRNRPVVLLVDHMESWGVRHEGPQGKII